MHQVDKSLAVLGACGWIALVACGGVSSGSRDSSVLPTGGQLGSGGTAGATRADASVGAGGSQGGSGGTAIPDARTGSGGQAGGGGRSGSGGGTGGPDALVWDSGNGGACGASGVTCGSGQFCDLASKCGALADAPGTCEATGPQVGCTKEYRPVCGCNLVSYDNDCLRRAAGVLKQKEGLCGGPLDGSLGGSSGHDGSIGTGGVGGAGGTTGTSPKTTYLGCTWPGGLDHMILQKRDLEHDECIVLELTNPSSSREGYTVTLPEWWGLVRASISPCTGTGTAVTASSARGTIWFGPSFGPEVVYPPEAADVDVQLGVTLVDGGPTLTYTFKAESIDLTSGC